MSEKSFAFVTKNLMDEDLKKCETTSYTCRLKRRSEVHSGGVDGENVTIV